MGVVWGNGQWFRSPGLYLFVQVIRLLWACFFTSKMEEYSSSFELSGWYISGYNIQNLQLISSEVVSCFSIFWLSCSPFTFLQCTNCIHHFKTPAQVSLHPWRSLLPTPNKHFFLEILYSSSGIYYVHKPPDILLWIHDL